MSTQRPHGSQAITLSEDGAVSIRLSQLDMPDRVFNANWASYDLNGGTVNLIFGQKFRGQSRLMSALVVSVPTERVVIHFELPISPQEGRFVTVLREFVTTSTGHAREIDAFTPDVLPDERIAFESASLFGVALSGVESEISFVKVSPWDLHRFKVQEYKGNIAFPVVRVFLNSDLLLGLADSLTRVLSGAQESAS
jgi:hypothetical protein